jgi:GNAT superfamily N-acetyltransferase
VRPAAERRARGRDDDIGIRRASPVDVSVAEAIIAGALAGYGLPFEPEGRDADVRSFGARADHDDFVAELDFPRLPVGVASVGPHGDDGVAWLSKVFVSQDARGLGLGRALLRAAHDAARARGYRRVGLRTRAVFREAIALYESEGYVAEPADPRLLAEGDRVYFLDL